MSAPRKPGLLVINLGTPDAPTTPAVRRYLRQFLSDPRVIDLPAVPRWLLLNLIILPTRPKKSAHAYQQIWTPQGSPLLVIGRAFTGALTKELGGAMEVELAMRYGNPSIEHAVGQLRARGVTDLTVLSLYPQYAASTIASTQDELMRVLRKSWDIEPVLWVPPFFDDEGFLSAFAQVARPKLAEARADHVLISFHGLPERQIHKSAAVQGHCLASPSCCDALTEKNHRCYRAQSYATARMLAARLGLSKDQYTVTFQSRLGRTPWIRPYTDHTVEELAKQGKKRLAVMVPSFVADCLETLEEIALRNKEAFVAAGGEDLILIPSLNADPAWVSAAANLVRRTAALETTTHNAKPKTHNP